MKNKPRKRTCLCGCEKKFYPKVEWQLYISLLHKNRAAQKRLRERAKVK